MIMLKRSFSSTGNCGQWGMYYIKLSLDAIVFQTTTITSATNSEP